MIKVMVMMKMIMVMVVLFKHSNLPVEGEVDGDDQGEGHDKYDHEPAS